jgi:hypothetical protein
MTIKIVYFSTGIINGTVLT